MNARHCAGAMVLAALLVGCATGRVDKPAVDAEIREMAGSARAAYDRGEISRASELYGRALARARRVDDVFEASRNAYNLALCMAALDRTAEARGLLAQARVALPAKGEAVARIWLAEAEVARRDGGTNDVRVLAQRALEAGPDRVGRVQARLLLAGLACEEGACPAARGLLKEARQDIDLRSDPVLLAQAAAIAVRLAIADGDVEAAAAGREEQAVWLRQAGRYREMAETLLAAGTDYRRAGEPRKAYLCLLRAAASFQGMGAKDQAVKAAAGAVAVARELNEPEWVAAAVALAAEISRP